MKKRILTSEENRKNVSPEQYKNYAATLKKMVDCKTVFTRDGENAEEYKKFNDVIAESFPNLSAKAEKLVFGSGCFVYVITGF